VLDQLAAAHIRARAVAHDDGGNQAAGATSALAAADELHQAGTLLDTVEWRLDAASQHSGRIAWHPEPAEAGRTTLRAGKLTLTVWPDEPLGEHHRYAYRIEDTATGESIEGRDLLFTGTGAPVSPSEALRELAGHLIDAAQAYYQALEDGGPATESGGPFPVWVADAALHAVTELAQLDELGLEVPDLARAGSPEAGARWISVVFLEGPEADEVLDLIARKGTDAAIEHLAGHDYGEETTQAALENGYVYDQPPTGPLDKVAARDVYTLTYSPFLGHVSLLREHGALPDPALLGIDTPAPAPEPGAAAHQTARQLASAARRERPGGEWFTRQPGPASAQGRGLAL
jgi:hypothetical protein